MILGLGDLGKISYSRSSLGDHITNHSLIRRFFCLFAGEIILFYVHITHLISFIYNATKKNGFFFL